MDASGVQGELPAALTLPFAAGDNQGPQGVQKGAAVAQQALASPPLPFQKRLI